MELTTRNIRQSYRPLGEELRGFTSTMASRLTDSHRVALGIKNHEDAVVALKQKLRSGKRLMRLAQMIGWVVIVAGDWMPKEWFERSSDNQWLEIESQIVIRRQFFREEAIQVLGLTDSRWMLEFPLCASRHPFTLTVS